MHSGRDLSHDSLHSRDENNMAVREPEENLQKIHLQQFQLKPGSCYVLTHDVMMYYLYYCCDWFLVSVTFSCCNSFQTL